MAIRVWCLRMWRASLAAVYFAFNWLIYKLDYARSFRWEWLPSRFARRVLRRHCHFEHGAQGDVQLQDYNCLYFWGQSWPYLNSCCVGTCNHRWPST